MDPTSMLQILSNRSTISVFPGSSMVEHSAVNRRVASSNLARGANFFFFLSYLQTAIFPPLRFRANCHGNVTVRAFRTAACWFSPLLVSPVLPFPAGSDVLFQGSYGAS